MNRLQSVPVNMKRTMSSKYNVGSAGKACSGRDQNSRVAVNSMCVITAITALISRTLMMC